MTAAQCAFDHRVLRLAKVLEAEVTFQQRSKPSFVDGGYVQLSYLDRLSSKLPNIRMPRKDARLWQTVVAEFERRISRFGLTIRESRFAIPKSRSAN